jgi:hypothetical protein
MIVAASLAACPTFGNLGVIQSARGEKERNVSPDDVADADLVRLPSAHSAAFTVERLKTMLAKNGINLFARIDHAAGRDEAVKSLDDGLAALIGAATA